MRTTDKTFLKFLLIAVFAAGMNLASAALINITMEDATTKVDDISKNANPTGSNSNSASNHFDWLDNYVVDWYNGFTGATLPDPSGLALVQSFGDVGNDGVPTFDLTGIAYITYHYGKGSGGTGGGGGLVAIYNDAMTGDFTPPASGAGPNGLGGLSTVYAWGSRTSVPDGGATVALLGLTLLGLSVVRKKLASK